MIDAWNFEIVFFFQQELEDTKKKLQDTQEELSAWKFTPDSATGKRLMSKCRQLLQENEDIGKMISSGRLNKLENELAMQKALCEEMKKNQEEMDDFVQELDLDVEGMQSTIYFLQQQLKDAKKTIADYESGSAGKKEDGGERELKRDNDQTDSISPKRARTDLGDQAIAVDAVSNEWIRDKLSFKFNIFFNNSFICCVSNKISWRNNQSVCTRNTQSQARLRSHFMEVEKFSQFCQVLISPMFSDDFSSNGHASKHIPK